MGLLLFRALAAPQHSHAQHIPLPRGEGDPRSPREETWGHISTFDNCQGKVRSRARRSTIALTEAGRQRQAISHGPTTEGGTSREPECAKCRMSRCDAKSFFGDVTPSHFLRGLNRSSSFFRTSRWVQNRTQVKSEVSLENLAASIHFRPKDRLQFI